MSQRFVAEDIIEDMKTVRDNTLYTMCKLGGYPSFLCSQDDFWYERIKSKNPSLITLYRDMYSSGNIPKKSYYDFYFMLANLGIMDKIIYPSKDNQDSYFLIDTKIDPHIEPYVLIEELEDTKVNETPKRKYILVPDLILAKVAGSDQFRIIRFNRGMSRQEFAEATSSSRVEVIQNTDIKKNLQLFESLGLFSVRRDFTTVKERLEAEGIARVI